MANVIQDGLLFVATWAGPALSLVMLAPIAWRPIADRGVTGLSPTGTVMTAVTVQLWLTYGIMSHDPRQIGVNVGVYAVRAAIMIAAVWGCRQQSTRTLAIATAVAGLALVGAGATAVGLAAMLLSTINRTPQAVHTIRNGAGAGLSVSGFALGAAADLSWVAYGLVANDPIIVMASAICAAFDALIVVAATRPDHALIALARRALTAPETVAEPVVYGVAAGD